MSITAPISYWKLDESSGNASDSVGSNTLTNTNVTYSTGKINNGAVFNGSNAKLVKANDSFGSSYSFSFWIYRNNNTNIYGVISKDDGSTRVASILSQTSGNIDGTLWLSSGQKSISPFAITNSVWNHIVVTLNSTDARVYLNGALNQTIVTGLGASTTSFGTWFGADQFSGGRWFLDGIMDEIGYWNSVLTASEITDLYNSGNGKSYPFGTAYLYDVTSIAMTMTLNSIQTAIAYVREVSSIAMTMTINNVIFGYIYNFTVTSISMVLSINPVSWALKTWATFAKSATATVTNTAKSVSNWINQSKN